MIIFTWLFLFGNMVPALEWWDLTAKNQAEYDTSFPVFLLSIGLPVTVIFTGKETFLLSFHVYQISLLARTLLGFPNWVQQNCTGMFFREVVFPCTKTRIDSRRSRDSPWSWKRCTGCTRIAPRHSNLHFIFRTKLHKDRTFHRNALTSVPLWSFERWEHGNRSNSGQNFIH